MPVGGIKREDERASSWEISERERSGLAACESRRNSGLVCEDTYMLHTSV